MPVRVSLCLRFAEETFVKLLKRGCFVLLIQALKKAAVVNAASQVVLAGLPVKGRM